MTITLTWWHVLGFLAIIFSFGFVGYLSVLYMLYISLTGDVPFWYKWCRRINDE